MQKTVLIAVLTIALVITPFLAGAEVYKWVDEKGDIHFTDDYSKVPEKYRPTEEFQKSPKEGSTPSIDEKPTSAAPPKGL
jgi:hypothetical protein